MSSRPVRSTCLVASLATCLPAAHAASGGIDSFWASATTVNVGDTVSFEVAMSLGTTAWAHGGSNTSEPPPQEGYQEWNVNWYAWEQEALRSVWLQAGSQGFADSPTLNPGDSYTNTWTFSVTFTEAGTHQFDLSGGWQSDIYSGNSNESASRNCYYVDPDNPGDLWCDSWYWQYSDANDWYSSEGSLWGGTISVEVLATPVPEPATWALMLAGAGLLAARARRTRR